MGQYFYVVNLDKREYLHPHHMGCGLKFSSGESGPPDVFGRWEGDRVVIVGDYADDVDAVSGEQLYQACDGHFTNIPIAVMKGLAEADSYVALRVRPREDDMCAPGGEGPK